MEMGLESLCESDDTGREVGEGVVSIEKGSIEEDWTEWIGRYIIGGLIL